MYNGPDCRWCGTATDAEFVDVGVGMVQVTGGHCPECGGLELARHQIDGPLSEVEMVTGWIGPFEDDNRLPGDEIWHE